MGALQVGRRSMIVCGALVVAPTSDVFTPQELAHRMVALDYGNGTAYAGLQMLEGAMPREAVTTRAATVHSGERLAALLRGRVRGHGAPGAVDHARGEGRMPPGLDHVLSRHVGRGCERHARRRMPRSCARRPPPCVGSTPTSAGTCRTSSSTSPSTRGSQALSPADFNLGRIQLKEPGPIPEDEARWAWEWMASWGLMTGTFDAAAQINASVEREAHELAATGR